MRVVAILFFFMSSAIQAQTIEERLPECIEEAEELLLRGTRVRAALASESGEDNINNILEVMFAREIIEMFNGLIEQHIEKDSTASELQNNLEKVSNPMGNRFDYIADMMSEHWEDRGNSAKARFIAGCANNFDGKAETQADQIANLQTENLNLRNQIRELENAKSEASAVIDLLAASERIVVERQNEIARMKSKFASESRYFEVTKKRLNDQLTELTNDIEKRKESYSKLRDEHISLKEKISDFLQLYDQTTFLRSIEFSSVIDRAQKIRNSALVRTNVVEHPDEFACVNLLRTKRKLGDICAFKLASYLANNAAK